MMHKTSIGSVICCVVAQSACAAPVGTNDKSDTRNVPIAAEGSKMSEVANLPYARGHSFRTLDEYLAYLEQYNGPVDMPWWREILN